MGSIAVEPRTFQPPPRFSTVAWGTFVGVVFGVLCFWLLGVAAGFAGLLGWEGVSHATRGALDRPFRQDGLWSAAANVVVGIGCACVVGACIWDRVERSTNRPVSLRRTIAIVVGAGYVPFLLGVPNWLPFLGFLAVAFLVRRFAIGPPPSPWERRARRAVVAVAAFALLVPASYGATHPLWYGTHVFASAAPQGADWRAHRIVYRPTQNEVVRVGITIDNHGRFSPTLLGITGGTHGIRVVGAVAGSLPPGAGTRRLGGTVVHPGNDQFVTLMLALRACGGARRIDTLDRVTAYYRLFGATFAQPIALAIRPTVSC